MRHWDLQPFPSTLPVVWVPRIPQQKTLRHSKPNETKSLKLDVADRYRDECYSMTKDDPENTSIIVPYVPLFTSKKKTHIRTVSSVIRSLNHNPGKILTNQNLLCYFTTHNVKDSSQTINWIICIIDSSNLHKKAKISRLTILKDVTFTILRCRLNIC